MNSTTKHIKSLFSSYRFGFNGKEDLDEVSGWQDYGERMYNRLIGRFPTPDPLIVKGQQYPELSPYQFASNTPIWALDLDGLEAWPANHQVSEVMSINDFRRFAVAEIKRLGQEDIKFDCADLPLYLFARYHFEREVELSFKNPIGGKTYSSNDTYYGNYTEKSEEGPCSPKSSKNKT